MIASEMSVARILHILLYLMNSFGLKIYCVMLAQEMQILEITTTTTTHDVACLFNQPIL